MHITLQSMTGELLANAEIVTDKHGYLHADHPTFSFEVECALYGYQEGGVSTDTIADEDGNAYIRWTITTIKGA